MICGRLAGIEACFAWQIMASVRARYIVSDSGRIGLNPSRNFPKFSFPNFPKHNCCQMVSGKESLLFHLIPSQQSGEH